MSDLGFRRSLLRESKNEWNSAHCAWAISWTIIVHVNDA